MPATLHRDSWEQYAAIMQAENKRFRDALESIVALPQGSQGGYKKFAQAQTIAREAIKSE